MHKPSSIYEFWLIQRQGVALRRRLRPKEAARFAGGCLALAALCFSGCGPKEQATPPPPPEVEVVTPEQRDVPIVKEWVATLNGSVNAQIRAQVTGYLMRQNYTNGSFVRKDAPLFQIDPRTFQAALEQTKASLEQARGNLQQAEAKLGKTQLDVARYTPLARQSAISQQELDDAVQANIGARAEVESAKAAIEAAKAAMETAQLNLGFTTITSPIDGVAAIATAQVGDLVGPQTETLTTVSTVNPIFAEITPSEQEYLRAMEVTGGREEEIARRLQFELILADGTTYPHTGRLFAIDRQIDIRTGAVLLQTEFPNPGNLLRPGGFGRVKTVTRIQKDALLVPERAVTELQGGYLVAVVGSDNKVSIRQVKTGARVGTMWIIEEGLKPGEKIVAEGTQKVREGAVVNPKPFQARPVEK